MFFSLYTLGESDDVLLEPFENQLTPNFGYVLFGMFHISNITILISMLIAMMTKSFDSIMVIYYVLLTTLYQKFIISRTILVL